MTLSFPLDPGGLLRIAYKFSKEIGTFLLYSGGCGETSQCSYLCLEPYETIVIEDVTHNPWDLLKKSVGHTNSSRSIPEWVGFLGYELGAFAEPDKKCSYYVPKIPYAYFQKSKATLCLNHQTGMATVYATEPKFLEMHFWQEVDDIPQDNISASLAYPIDSSELHAKKIAQIQEYLWQGEIYQANLSHTVHMQGKVDAFALFAKLAGVNPAPFSVYFHIAQCTVVCTSPERLLKRQERALETRPIKGTAPRGVTVEEDNALKRALLNSEKERAELLMITDLMRNDLGRISEPGSVVTTELFRQEAYTNVFHLISVISSQIQKGLHPVDAIRQVFPGGSVTGCPKLRALEAIYEIEKEARGIYTGCIGYFAENGDFDFNIAIRTLVVQGTALELRLGGGIVVDSDALSEYEETLHKGRSFFKVMGVG